MFFNKKIDRIYEFKEEQREKAENNAPDDFSDEYFDPSEYKNQMSTSDNLEKGDLFAMIVSAWITIVPICLGVLLFIVFVSWFLLGLW